MILFRLVVGVLGMPGLLMLLMLFSGCKKSFEPMSPTASIRILNVIPSLPLLYTSFNGTIPLIYYSTAATLSYSLPSVESNYFNRTAGVNNIALYRASDTLHPNAPYYKLSIDLASNQYYSLFITGTLNHPDTLFLKEDFRNITDSATGIRFINLSPGSDEMSVNIQGNPNGSTVSSLPYKRPSDFVFLPAHANINAYTFEVRNKLSGVVILSYTTSKINQYLPTGVGTFRNLWLFRNTTLMVTGLPGGVGEDALRIKLVNH